MQRALIALTIGLCGAAAAADTGNWTLGILTGPSPFELSTPAGITNPVLRGSDVTDLPNIDTLAHPFMVIEGGRYYLFFTAKDHGADKGGIGMAESADGLRWKYRKAVVHETFVTAHPFIFKVGNDYYMIPESHTEPFLRLYRATHFPDEWKYERDLMKGDRFISPVVVQYKDMWWMYTIPSGNATLRLFYSKTPLGQWTEHPMSPIVKNDLRTARPAGRPLVIGGKLYRLGMDCVPTYGRQVRAFQVTRISPTVYSEALHEKPLVKASGKGWNADAMHHVDAHEIAEGKWIAAVDALGK